MDMGKRKTNKTERLHIRLTEAEKAQVKRLAEQERLEISVWFRKRLARNWHLKEVGALETTIRDTKVGLAQLSTKLMEIGMRLDDPIDQIEIDECRDLISDLAAELMRSVAKHPSRKYTSRKYPSR